MFDNLSSILSITGWADKKTFVFTTSVFKGTLFQLFNSINFNVIMDQKSEFFSNSDQNKILEFVKLTYDPV